MLTYEIHGRVPSGILTSADAPFIDLNVPFEIRDGELLITPPSSAWHDATSQSIREYLKPRHTHVAQDMIVTLGANGRRPDVVGLSVSLDKLLAARARSLSHDVVQVAVEVISHDDAAAGIPEYWIVDEVTDAPHDASVEIYPLQGTGYVPITVVRLAELMSGEQPG